MQENELKAFIKENRPLIYEYINSEILKDIGVMSLDFFVRLIDEYFVKKEKKKGTGTFSFFQAPYLIHHFLTKSYDI